MKLIPDLLKPDRFLLTFGEGEWGQGNKRLFKSMTSLNPKESWDQLALVAREPYKDIKNNMTPQMPSTGGGSGRVEQPWLAQFKSKYGQ